jgi:hypothetical protein
MPDDRRDVERELGERATDEKRQSSGSTPSEETMRRAMEIEPGVEWHAGEDAGEVPERSDEDDPSSSGAGGPT